MYFSQQESGQSTLCEHLIGLTAGEDEEEEDRWGGSNRGEETKTWEKSVSRWDLKFVVSDVDKCISGRLTLDIVHQSGN